MESALDLSPSLEGDGNMLVVYLYLKAFPGEQPVIY